MEAILGSPINPKFNVYDIREKCDKPPLCYDFSAADTLLARADVLAALGVTGRSWTECNKPVHTALLKDWMTDLSPKVKDILNGGMDVLVYSGDKDFICNWRGGEAWTQNQDWDSAADFKAATYNSWNNGAGQLKMAKNFKFLRVLNAGHMVPMNQP